MIVLMVGLTLAMTSGSLAAQKNAAKPTESLVEPTGNDGSENDDIESAEEKEVSEHKKMVEGLIGPVEEALPVETKNLIKALSETIKKEKSQAPITNDAVIFGILMLMLGAIFWSSSSNIWIFKKFYKVVPMLLSLIHI